MAWGCGQESCGLEKTFGPLNFKGPNKNLNVLSDLAKGPNIGLEVQKRDLGVRT